MVVVPPLVLRFVDCEGCQLVIKWAKSNKDARVRMMHAYHVHRVAPRYSTPFDRFMPVAPDLFGITCYCAMTCLRASTITTVAKEATTPVGVSVPIHMARYSWQASFPG